MITEPAELPQHPTEPAPTPAKAAADATLAALLAQAGTTQADLDKKARRAEWT